jgi:hypothetical protein
MSGPSGLLGDLITQIFPTRLGSILNCGLTANLPPYTPFPRVYRALTTKELVRPFRA